VILVDTSVWIDHLRTTNNRMRSLLFDKEVLIHPFIIGELAVGNLHPRDEMLALLKALPAIGVAGDDEVLELIEQHRLFGRGVGYVDAHLLTAARLAAGTLLWARDRRLHDAANQLGLAAHITHQPSRHLTMRSGV
jgi:predicted nucleic acid-binding protein